MQPAGPWSRVVVLAVAMAALSFWCFRRAAVVNGRPVDSQKKQRNKVVLALLALGWVAFGVVYGLRRDNPVAIVVALAAGALTAALAAYVWRLEGRGLPIARREGLLPTSVRA